MTQLSFDAGKRVPLLDLAPVTKPARPGENQNDQFNSHLNRASTPPTAPPSSADPAFRPPANSSSEAKSPQTQEDPSTAAESNPGATDRNDDSATTTSTTQSSDQPPVKKGDSDKEKDHDDEDEVAISEASVALVQQVAIVDAKADVKIDELGEEVDQITDPSGNEPKQREDAAQAKPKKQVNQEQAAAHSLGDNKPAATEAAKNTATPEVAVEVAQPASEDATLVSEDPLAVKASVGADEEVTSTKQRTTTTTITDGQTDESLVLIPNENLPDETETIASTEEVLPEPTSKPEITANSARVTNQSAETASADYHQQQAEAQSDAVATSGELPPDANSNGDPSSDQGETQFDQRAEQGLSSTSENKSSVAKSSTSEGSPVTKHLAPATEAPVVRAENSTSATNATSGSEAMSAADRARFVQRVSRALHVAHERGGEVRLRLSPPELGNLTLELKLHDGAMTAHIEAETSAARTLLLDNLSVLKERLAAQDIKVERFDVELRDQSGQQSPNGQSQDSDAGRSVRHAMKKPFLNGAPAEEKGVSPSIRPTSTSGQLNVII